MKILKNFDAKRIVKAKNKILLAIASVLFLALLVSSSAFREFVSKHPGLIGVLVAVSGEVYFDWKEESGRHAKWKKFFMALLVVSLAYELYEASESDKKAADAIKLAGRANEAAGKSNERAAVAEKEAGQANERAGAVNKLAADANESAAKANERTVAMELTNVALSLKVEELRSTNFVLEARVFGLEAQMKHTITEEATIGETLNETRAFVSESNTTARLNEAKDTVAAASKAAADVGNIVTNSNLKALSQVLPKPLKERLIDCLNSIDPRIIKDLPNHFRTIPMHSSGEMENFKFNELEKMSQEPGARDFIIVHNDGGMGMTSDGKIMLNISLDINPDLLKK